MSLLLACIGQDPINGYSRFTFGNHNLIGGLSLVPVLIGVFSLPEVFNLVEELARSRGHEHQQERIQVGSMRVSPKMMALPRGHHYQILCHWRDHRHHSRRKRGRGRVFGV